MFRDSRERTYKNDQGRTYSGLIFRSYEEHKLIFTTIKLQDRLHDLGISSNASS